MVWFDFMNNGCVRVFCICLSSLMICCRKQYTPLPFSMQRVKHVIIDFISMYLFIYLRSVPFPLQITLWKKPDSFLHEWHSGWPVSLSRSYHVILSSQLSSYLSFFSKVILALFRSGFRWSASLFCTTLVAMICFSTQSIQLLLSIFQVSNLCA